MGEDEPGMEGQRNDGRHRARLCHDYDADSARRCAKARRKWRQIPLPLKGARIADVPVLLEGKEHPGCVDGPGMLHVGRRGAAPGMPAWRGCCRRRAREGKDGELKREHDGVRFQPIRSALLPWNDYEEGGQGGCLQGRCFAASRATIWLARVIPFAV